MYIEMNEAKNVAVGFIILLFNLAYRDSWRGLVHTDVCIFLKECRDFGRTLVLRETLMFVVYKRGSN